MLSVTCFLYLSYSYLLKCSLDILVQFFSEDWVESIRNLDVFSTNSISSPRQAFRSFLKDLSTFDEPTAGDAIPLAVKI